jgi:hypothetical protein
MGMSAAPKASLRLFQRRGRPGTFPRQTAIVFAHRRWGKDSVALNLMAMSATLWPGNYIYMFPLLVQARTALWTNFDRRRGGNVLGFGLSSGDTPSHR